MCTCNSTHMHKSQLTVYERSRRRDPTRTLTLRRNFARNFSRRIRTVRGMIRHAVVTQDVFDLKQTRPTVMQDFKLTVNVDSGLNPKQFRGMSIFEKIRQFMRWIHRIISRVVFGTEDFEDEQNRKDKSWMANYINQAYKRGIKHANDDLQENGYDVPTIQSRGGLDAIARSLGYASVAALLMSKIVDKIKEAATAAKNGIQDLLANALEAGDSAGVIASKLNHIMGGGKTKQRIRDSVRGVVGRFKSFFNRTQTTARTETVNAHHKGTYKEYKENGAEKVQVYAELQTAGDDKVCPDCLALEEQGPMPIEQTQDLIPVHPGCRCTLKVVPPSS